jgi:4-hydroxy-2-oxoglutarate aldolase
MVYNAPKFAAGLNLSTSLISKLALHPNIAGMKDTSKEDIRIYCDAVPKGANFYVLAGSIEKFYKGLVAGAIGGVLSIANYLPALCCELHQAFLDGKMDEAKRLDEYSRTLSSNAAGKFGVAGVKAAMDALGYFGGDPRLPLEPLSQAEKDNLRAVLKKENLL